MNTLSISWSETKRFLRVWHSEQQKSHSSEERVAHILDYDATNVRIIADEIRQLLKANGIGKTLQPFITG